MIKLNIRHNEYRKAIIFSVILLGAFILGFLISQYTAKFTEYKIITSFEESFKSVSLWKHIRFFLLIAISSVFPCGVFLIPCIFLIRGYLLGCTTYILLVNQSSDALYYGIVLYITAFFYLVGLFYTGTMGVELSGKQIINRKCSKKTLVSKYFGKYILGIFIFSAVCLVYDICILPMLL